MKLLSIETTPNPNSMKMNLDERLAKGVAITYTHKNRGDCPAYMEKILAIPGVSSVFRVEDFMAIQRKPTAEWEDILVGQGSVWRQMTRAITWWSVTVNLPD